jgi:hypothetical protein
MDGEYLRGGKTSFLFMPEYGQSGTLQVYYIVETKEEDPKEWDDGEEMNGM